MEERVLFTSFHTGLRDSMTQVRLSLLMCWIALPAAS